MTSEKIDWLAGVWTNLPEAVKTDGDDLVVTAVEGSDAWRVTSYGFIHDSEHALLTDFEQNSAVEVSFTADFAEQFDQAGIFIRESSEAWVKAGVEFADGVLNLGAVVTRGVSDWSAGAVDWQGERITIRASRQGDAITVRARTESTPFRLVRLLPVPPQAVLSAGPMLCAPTRAGLTVRFHSWVHTAADGSLH